jgi:hypothetical protein
MHFHEKSIDIARIDLEDTRFRITTRSEIPHLSASIHEVGLITLPILKQKGTDFIIISGFRRIDACILLGILQVKARILDEGVEDPASIKIAITENAFQRPLDLIEQARAIHLLGKYIKDDTALGKIASGLGLPGNPAIIKKLKNIYNLPIPLQGCILKNTLSLTTALELGTLEKQAGTALADLFDELKTSLNKQKEIINLIREIALIEGGSMLEVLQESELHKIINSKYCDRTQKTAAIRSCLKKKRFPAITACEENFKKIVTGLRLGEGIKLVPPKNFEGQDYKLTIAFKSYAELEKRQVTLNRIIGGEKVKAIFNA